MSTQTKTVIYKVGYKGLNGIVGLTLLKRLFENVNVRFTYTNITNDHIDFRIGFTTTPIDIFNRYSDELCDIYKIKKTTLNKFLEELTAENRKINYEHTVKNGKYMAFLGSVINWVDTHIQNLGKLVEYEVIGGHSTCVRILETYEFYDCSESKSRREWFVLYYNENRKVWTVVETKFYPYSDLNTIKEFSKESRAVEYVFEKTIEGEQEYKSAYRNKRQIDMLNKQKEFRLAKCIRHDSVVDYSSDEYDD